VTTTRWGRAIDPDAVLQEHPRPQLVRDGWQVLNGHWRYAIEPAAGADESRPAGWAGSILVPFPPEAPLSGVGRVLQPDEVLWYSRSLRLLDGLGAERVLLHFGAVDQSCVVLIDGTEVGRHDGGVLPFSIDVTRALADRVEHELVVRVTDPTDTGTRARGKQRLRHGGIWYTPHSGIWQTVWLESTPAVAVDRLDLVPDLAGGAIEATVHPSQPTSEPAVVIVRADGVEVGRAEAPCGLPTRIPLSRIEPWTPDRPFLYDVEVALGEDRVRSYAGLRSVGMRRDADGAMRLLLNGEPILHAGLLDQGYWPDGLVTPPSDEAMIFDIELAKSMGFTMLRKHIKVEPARWYHHCDRLGMLVWQDMVNGGGRYHPITITLPAVAPWFRRSDRHLRAFAREDAVGRESFLCELRETIELLRSSPSVVLWGPFNEGWGQFDAARVADEVRVLDPTRLIDHASGWHDQGAGDLTSLHVYFRRFRMRRGWRRLARAVALTEFGGYSLPVDGHRSTENEFGYRRYRDRAAFAAAVERLWLRELVPAARAGLAAFVYTQLTDVEDEVNGVVTDDREVVKLDPARMVELNRAVSDAAAGRPPAARPPAGRSS